MWWIDFFGSGFAVWFGPDMVDIFQTKEEAVAFVEVMVQ